MFIKIKRCSETFIFIKINVKSMLVGVFLFNYTCYRIKNIMLDRHTPPSSSSTPYSTISEHQLLGRIRSNICTYIHATPQTGFKQL
jgi:hypothetical protein